MPDLAKLLPAYHRAKVDQDREVYAQPGTLYKFVQAAWHTVPELQGRPFQDNWSIPEVCTHLEAVSIKKVRRLVINIPPGCMKTLLVNVMWPCWEWVQRPNTRFFSVSYDNSVSYHSAENSLAVFRSQWFLDRWGDTCTIPHVVATGDYSNVQGGRRFSTSIGGALIGTHSDIVTVDDPIKPKDLSKVKLVACEDWWRGTLPTRFADPAHRRIVVVMQRLHQGDMSAIAEAEGFEVLRLPMRFEPKACSYTSVGGDARTEEGELLWPARFPEETLQELAKSMTVRGIAAQLQQRPAPDSGAIFQREWFKFWTRNGANHRILPTKFDKIIQSWDCAFKGQEDSDYVCGQVWGRAGPDYYLLHQVMRKMGFADTMQAIRDVSRDYPQCITKLIEDKANGTAIIEMLQKELSGILAVNPEGGKEARANAVTGLYQGGNVYYPHPEECPWINAHMENMCVFPMGNNDDDIDAETQALVHLHANFSTLAAAMKKLEEMQKKGLTLLS